MKWTNRKGTRDARHIPDNAEDLCEEAAMRYLNVVVNHNIVPDLIVNMDQQGVVVLLGNDHTYDEKGSKQVNIAARDERRAFTLCVASTPSGILLPFQQVWSGSKADRVLPTKAQRASAEAKGIHITVAQSEKKTSHFSTLTTMKEVSKITTTSAHAQANKLR
jgi:hypothetical protein